MKPLITIILIITILNSFGQVYEKFHKNSSLNMIELNDTSMLCTSIDSIFSINKFTGIKEWGKPFDCCMTNIERWDSNSFICFGVSSMISIPNSIPNIKILKVNLTGDTLWSKEFDKTINNPIGKILGKNIYIGGFNGHHSFLYKLDSVGNLVDSISFNPFYFESMVIDDRGIAVSLTDNNFQDLNILKIDSNLNIVDTLIYNTTNNYIFDFHVKDSIYIMSGINTLMVLNKDSAQTLYDSTFLNYNFFNFTFYNDTIIAVTGTYEISNSSDDDVLVAFFDLKNKQLIKHQRFGSKSNYDIGHSIHNVNDGGLIISGYTEYFPNTGYGYYFKVDSNLSVNPCSKILKLFPVYNRCLGSTYIIFNESFGINKTYTLIIGEDTLYNQSVYDAYVAQADSVGVINVQLINCNDTIIESFEIIDTLLQDFTYHYVGDSIEFRPPIDNNMKSFRWDFGDGNYKIDSIVKHKYSSSGDYLVSLKMFNDVCFLQQYDSLSISLSNESVFNISNSIVIYPNPSDGVFSYKLNSNINAEKLLVVDLTGRTVLSREIAKDIKGSIDLSDFSKGVYFIKFETTDKIFIEKIILQ